MHPLMPAILLRMAGLDALDLDPETEPPDGEFAEAVDRMGGRERHAVVGPNSPRQPKFLEGALEHREGEFLLRRREGFTGQQVAAGEVGDGQRVTVLAITDHDFAFVVW